MTSTAARHRAPLSARAWAARTWLAVSALPVGALAGCTTLAVAASADRPALGLLGLGAAVVPLSVASWRARLADVDPRHGRRAAGRPLLALDAESLPTTRLEAAAATAAQLLPLPIVLDTPDLASLQAATGAHGSPVQGPRTFTVAAGGSGVEVVVLTREERAARDLQVLQELEALDGAGARSAAPLQHAAA